MLVAAAVLVAGCATFGPSYRYQPRPAIIELTENGVEAGCIEVTVLGAREASGTDPACIDVCVRLVRRGQTSVAAPPDDMTLLAADGRRLPVHRADPATARSPAAGGAETFTVAFALPPPAALDDVRLSSLELHIWTKVGEERGIRRIRFEREAPDHPWWNPWGRGPE